MNDLNDVANAICQSLNVNQNIPYSYRGINYLSAQELVKTIINKRLTDDAVNDKKQNELSHSLTVVVEQGQETIKEQVYNVRNTKITVEGNSQDMPILARLLKKCNNVKSVVLIQKEKIIPV